MQNRHWLIAVVVTGILGQLTCGTAQAQSTLGLTLSPIGNTNGRFELRVNGPPSRVYRVDASADLVNWSLLSANVTGGALLVTDPAAPGFRYRFYRASASPELHGPSQE